MRFSGLPGTGALIIVLMCVMRPALAQDAFYGELNEAWHNGTPWPMLSAFEPGATLRDAYEAQFRYIGGLHGAIVGFKAGLTSPSSRERFGVDEPVAGALLEDMLVPAGPVSLGDFSQLMIEVELGFVMASDIDAPIAEGRDPDEFVEAVVPVIELPDLGFTDPSAISGVDIVAANVSARRVIAGERRPLPADLDSIRVRLLRDGEPLVEGAGRDAMGSQRAALAWLINRTLSTGFAIKRGQILITGALGRMVAGVPGSYRAEFSELDAIEFSVH